MSYNKFERMSFNSKDNTYIRKQLNEVWKHFMSSFGYQKYYSFSKEANNKLDNIHHSISSYMMQNNSSCISSIKLLFKFLEQNSITIIEKNNSHILISNNKKGLLLLSEVKIWIMYIIFIDQKFDDDYQNKTIIIMNLFKEAIKNNCDIISLFEFFLIYISKIDQEDFSIVKSRKIIELLPKEFILLYIKKKNILKNIFSKDSSKYNYFGTSKDFVNTQSTIFSTDKQNKNDYFLNINEKNEEFKLDEEKNNYKSDNKNKCLDINNLIIVCKDYLNKGYFAIFKDKKINKENDKNFIGNNEEEIDSDEDENYYLMPLLNQYNNYDQKKDANKVLILINKSIYKNYTYYPYDISIVNRL